MSTQTVQSKLPLPVSTEAPVIPAAQPGLLGLIDDLLRNRRGLIARIDAGDDLANLARNLVITLVVSAAVFGVTVGMFRGGLQILFAGIKVPLALLITAAFATPAFLAMEAAVTGKANTRRNLSFVLAGLALTGLLVSATAPIVLFAMSIMGYHQLFLVVVCCGGFAGLAGVSFFWQAFSRDKTPGRWLVATVFLGAFTVLGVQVTWTLRPYLERPRSPEVVFVRSIEGSFLESILVGYRSARGDFHGEAEVPASDRRR